MPLSHKMSLTAPALTECGAWWKGRCWLTIMKSLTLKGETLGEKRRHFNKLVADAVASKRYELTPIDYTHSDIYNLLKIEIACKTRNVDYVIEVMKSKDMLFASTAIKKSTWLITDPQYANIINPEYLHTQLKPYMTTKAFNKLILHIRLNLKDESRVEAFYEHLKSTRNSEKWLQNCSIPFIENAISYWVPVWCFRRLLKKSAHFLTFEKYIDVDAYPEDRQAAYLPMLKSRTSDVLDILEDTSRELFVVEMGKKRTEFLMKKYPQRVLENIKMYRWAIDMSVIARYMNKNEIAAFLCKNASDMGFCHDHKILIHFIKNMPEEERVKFIQKSFIDRTEMIFDKNEISFIDSSFRTTSEGFASESDFRDTLNKMESVLILLKDFNKTLSDYPFITKKIQDLNKIRQVNKWFVDMSCLYNVNKSWRKYMLEDSLSLSLCEETCLNALKHKPQLLTRHDKQIYTLQTNDAVSLRRVLAKLRVYWPDSLAWHWSKAYMQHLNGPTGHKAIIKGLFMLLSQDQVIELAKRYVPKNFKINWCLTDHTKINIRINIAKHLHLARPLVPLETVLWYAKGDYVQYAMQSHIAIWSALSEVDMGKNLSKFYDAPSEEDQLERLRKVEPAFDKVFQNWNKTNACKKNLESFLEIASLLFKNGNWYDDVEEYGPMIHDMFAAALDKMCKMLFIHNYLIIEMLRHMLNDEGFVPACLVVSKILPKSVHEETKHAQSEIFQKLKSNVSISAQLIIMPELMLEEDTFGEKRRKFNKLVADAVASKHYELTPITDTDSDINNLLKIEIACKTRNVDYVIEVMKSKDMLYTSTAIKKSTWLITDPQYANIINPEYLHTQLKPYMTTKAFNKLMLHIRLNLKDQSRVESFFEYFRETDGACKWLQNCSIPFIENVIKKRPVPAWLFKRLCKRSARFLGLYAYVEPYEGKAEQASILSSNMPRNYKPDPRGKKYLKYDFNLMQQAVNEYSTKPGKSVSLEESYAETEIENQEPKKKNKKTNKECKDINNQNETITKKGKGIGKKSKRQPHTNVTDETKSLFANCLQDDLEAGKSQMFYDHKSQLTSEPSPIFKKNSRITTDFE
ncbi:hypothetical protein HW555_014195 [Spodoptera exigua]|uniref:Uncharacterized protein n=1 Tax=Spodoptera exigua TaxID=7107 RepID=A0A835L1Q7_SPOEX|nr:hypothetical protein HW555_014195 [Spodoptera exigua]